MEILAKSVLHVIKSYDSSNDGKCKTLISPVVQKQGQFYPSVCLSVCLCVYIHLALAQSLKGHPHMKQLALLLTDLTRLISSGPSKVHLLA